MRARVVEASSSTPDGFRSRRFRVVVDVGGREVEGGAHVDRAEAERTLALLEQVLAPRRRALPGERDTDERELEGQLGVLDREIEAAQERHDFELAATLSVRRGALVRRLDAVIATRYA